MLLLFGYSIAFFYHLCNGIRHLAWDAGYGFELPDAYRSGYAVLAATALLTVLTWQLLRAFRSKCAPRLPPLSS